MLNESLSKMLGFVGNVLPGNNLSKEEQYNIGTTGIPSNTELARWGITRDAYKALYSKAAADFKAAGKTYNGSKTDEVNKFLKSQMTVTNGKYANAATTDTATASDTTAKVDTSTKASSAKTSTGSGSVSAPVAEEIKKMSADEIAALLDITHKKEDFLTALNKDTDDLYNEYDNEATKIKDSSARSMNSQYENYLNSLRESKANALNTGILKGTAEANNMMTMLGGQQANAAGQQTMFDTLSSLTDKRAAALSGNDALALDKSNAVKAELGNISTDYYGQDVNKYSTDIGARTSLAAANIAASGNVAAAKASSTAADPQVFDQLVQYHGGNISAALKDLYDSTSGKYWAAIGANPAR